MTGNELIAKFKRRFSDCGSTTALEYLNETVKELLYSIPYAKKQVSVSLVAEQGEYPLDETVLRVWAVRYVRSATEGDYSVLTETSEDELDSDRPAWRGETSDEPKWFYIDSNESNGGVLGLFPKPSAATDTGYPIVLVEASVYIPMETGNESLPSDPYIVDAFVDLMCFKRAKDKKLPEIGLWAQTSEKSLETAKMMFWGRNVHKQQETKPAVRVRKDWRNNR